MTNKKLILSSLSVIIIAIIFATLYKYFYPDNVKLEQKHIIVKKDSKDIIIATFGNGKSITKAQLETEIEKIYIQNPKLRNVEFNNLPFSQKESIIRQIILKELSYKQAKRQNIHRSNEYKKTKRLFEKELLQQKLFVAISQDASSEERLQKKYDELKTDLQDKKEVRIRYIALKTEKEAKSLYKKLKRNPESFASQAKSKSIDKSTSDNGGDLGFVVESNLPENITKEINKLKKGKISKAFKIDNVNWIIIKLEERRKAKVPEFNDIREKLVKDLGNEAIEKFATSSLDSANIKILLK
tara:strand:+ start:1533 stop:2429 length:897 start_codon:yes stop_codon:yes gene_type:complete